MSEPFLGCIIIVAFNFAPRGYAFCDGQILLINQNEALFSILGTTYGGDGTTSFALPDLRGRSPIHEDTGFGLGAKAGDETHPLPAGEMPAHDHGLQGSSDDGNTPIPAEVAGVNVVLAGSPSQVYINNPPGFVPMNADAVADAGSGQGHENMQPYLALNFAIALQGLFPSRN